MIWKMPFNITPLSTIIARPLFPEIQKILNQIVFRFFLQVNSSLLIYSLNRTLQNYAFVQILPENFREVLKSLTPKAFRIDQNPWFCQALLNFLNY